MAYSITRIATATNRHQDINVSSPSGNLFAGALITGATSGATALVVALGYNLSIVITKVIIFRISTTAFSTGETINWTGGGSATVGTVNSSMTHPLVIVTGTDTINVFDYICDRSVALGWGYHTASNYGRADYTASVMIGDPRQTAVTSAVSKKEAIDIHGMLQVAGNATYATTCKIGDGTMGDIETSENGSIISCDDTALWEYCGASKYGSMEAHASGFGRFAAGWENDLQRCEFYKEVDSFGALEFIMPTAFYSTSTDIARVEDCSASDPLYLGHIRPTINRLTIGSGAYGIVFTGSGTYTADAITVTDASTNVGFGWICTAAVTLRNCDLDESDITGFWSTFTTTHSHTINCLVKDVKGNAMQNVRVRAWDSTQTYPTDTPLINVLTNSSGVLASDQEIDYATNGYPSVYVNKRPITFLFQKDGYVSTKIIDAFDTPGPHIFNVEMKLLKQNALGEAQ